MNDKKTPNKHFFNSAHSFTYDDQKNDWQELSHNFYFLEEEDTETYYFNAEDGKNFFYDSNDDNLADAKKLFFSSIKIFFKKK